MASKANSRQAVNIKGRLTFIKSKKALSIEKTWNTLCHVFKDLILDDVVAFFWLTYASRKPDLDESLAADLIQGRLIENDRQIKRKHVYWDLDKDDPRAAVFVKAICAPECGGKDCFLSRAGSYPTLFP